MTEREAQIYRWIKEDPMISQQEIADRAGITRSSAAVHISNLMKKGIIKGKGYVLREESYITVVGAVNIDISGTPFEQLRTEDSNPGHMSLTLGGVGRNIAENLSRLGSNVELITALGDDFYAAEIERSCRSLNIGISHSLKCQGSATSMYLCINDVGGDMMVAVNDMEIYRKLTPKYLETKLPVINKGKLLVLDGNLTQEAIEFLAQKCTVPIIAEPVSIVKAARFKRVLPHIDLIKPNKFELEVLSGQKVYDRHSLEDAVEKLIEKGVHRIVVSRGEEGILFADEKEMRYYNSLACDPVNTTGCGDAMLAGITYALSEELNTESIVNYGLAASSICIEHEGAISPAMTLDNIKSRINLPEES